jgi:hypothetical protein
MICIHSLNCSIAVFLTVCYLYFDQNNTITFLNKNMTTVSKCCLDDSFCISSNFKEPIIIEGKVNYHFFYFLIVLFFVAMKKYPNVLLSLFIFIYNYTTALYIKDTIFSKIADCECNFMDTDFGCFRKIFLKRQILILISVVISNL